MESTRRSLFCKAAKSILIGGALALPIIEPSKAWAGIPLPATEFTQILNNIQLVASYIKQAAQLVSLANQEAMAIRNLIHNGIHSFSDIAGFLTTASSVAQGGLALAYSTASLDTAFAAKFPGFAKFAGGGANSWATQYINWAQTNRDTIMGSFRGLNLAANDLSVSQAAISAMQAHASTAVGAQQILETIAEFGQAQTGMLAKLNNLMLNNAQAQFSFMSMQQQHMDTQAAARIAFLSNGGATNTDSRVIDPITGVH